MEKQLTLIKSQHELIKSIKSQQKLTKQTKSQRELIKSQRTLKRLIKPKQTLSNTKERIEVIRKKLNELHNNFSKSELKEIRNHLYSIENKNELENSNEYLNELDKKIIKLNEYNNNDDDFIENVRDLFNIENKLYKKIIKLNEYNNNNDDFIENVRDLFNIVNYEPILIKTGFDNNYLEYRSEGNDSLSFEEYLKNLYLNDLINDKKDKGEWKLQLTAQINFISQKPGSDETRVMHTRSVCEEFMSGSETEEIAEKLFRSLLQMYQDNLNEKMRGSDFIFNGINYLFHDFNRVSISKGGSYIESPKWLKDKKCIVNQKNNDNVSNMPQP